MRWFWHYLISFLFINLIFWQASLKIVVHLSQCDPLIFLHGYSISFFIEFWNFQSPFGTFSQTISSNLMVTTYTYLSTCFCHAQVVDWIQYLRIFILLFLTFFRFVQWFLIIYIKRAIFYTSLIIIIRIFDDEIWVLIFKIVIIILANILK